MISVTMRAKSTVRFKTELFTSQDMQTEASSARDRVVARILSGDTAERVPMKPYSTRPIKIPVAGLGSGTQKVRPKPPGGRKIHAKGAKFVRFRRGYLQFREEAGLQTAHKDLNLTGALLRSFKARVYTAGRAAIGWTRAKDEQIGLELEKNERLMIFALDTSDVAHLERRIIDKIMDNLMRGLP